MFCPSCGIENPEGAQRCQTCGGDIKLPLVPPGRPVDPSVKTFCLSCGAPGRLVDARCGGCGAALRLERMPEQRMEDDAVMRALLPIGRTPLSMVAGYLGLASLLIFPSPLALIFGIIATVEIAKDPEKKKRGLGRAVTGIVMGLAGTIVLVMMLIGWMD